MGSVTVDTEDCSLRSESSAVGNSPPRWKELSPVKEIELGGVPSQSARFRRCMDRSSLPDTAFESSSGPEAASRESPALAEIRTSRASSEPVA